MEEGLVEGIIEIGAMRVVELTLLRGLIISWYSGTRS